MTQNHDSAVMTKSLTSTACSSCSAWPACPRPALPVHPHAAQPAPRHPTPHCRGPLSRPLAEDLRHHEWPPKLFLYHCCFTHSQPPDLLHPRHCRFAHGWPPELSYHHRWLCDWPPELCLHCRFPRGRPPELCLCHWPLGRPPELLCLWGCCAVGLWVGPLNCL